MLKILARLHRNQKGITGLETAIILIAFVVVAAVFAYTVLSAGLFSTQKSQEAVYSGIKETQSTLELRGSVVAYKGTAAIDSTIGKVEFTVTAQGDEAIDLTPPYVLTAGALGTSSLNDVMAISYNDANVTIAETAWTIAWIGNNSNDYLLEKNEKAVITVWLHTYDGAVWADGANPPFLGSNNVDTYHEFTLELKPSNGAVLNITRTTPAFLDTVVDLH